MDEQFTFPGFEPPEHQEVAFLDPLLPELKAAAANYGGRPEDLTYKSTKSDTSGSGYTVVSFKKLTAFRLRIRGTQHYISLPTVFSDLIPNSFPTKKLSSEEKYIRLLIDEKHPLESYRNFLIQIAGETVNRSPKEWDCCSRYLECSNAKTCVHPDKSFALGCGYRKILNSGRIFYGKNRNID